MRDYGVVRVRFWEWAKRKKLTAEAKEMALYLLTCPHANSLGCFRLPVAYVCDDLATTEGKVNKALEELQRVEFIHRDRESGWTWILDYLQHNPVPNGKVGKAVCKLLDQVPASLPFHADLIAELLNHEHLDHDALQAAAAKRATQDTVSADQDTVSRPAGTHTQTHTHEPTHEHEHTPAADAPDVDGAFRMFVEAARKHGWVEPRGLETDRKRKIASRLVEHGIDGWAAMLERAGRSEFLRTEFRLKLDWVLEPKNFRKVVEGNYDGKRGSTAQASLLGGREDTSQWGARVNGWRRSGFWMPNDWGPEPGEPGCRVPPSLLGEMRQ